MGAVVHTIPRTLLPIILGLKLAFAGDSQTAGREADGTTTKSPVHAICQILKRTHFAGNLVDPYSRIDTSDVYWNGRSGDSLAQTLAVYNAAGMRTDRTFVHFQESGSQDKDGQRTAEEFRATAYAMINAILANTPHAFILTETAFNFGRGPAPINPAEDWREWEPTYNAVLRQVIASYGKPNQIFLAETDYYIKALQAEIGATNVWFERGHAQEFHYRAAGNLMVAVGYLKALRYPIRGLCLDGIPTSEVSQSYRDTIIRLAA